MNKWIGAFVGVLVAFAFGVAPATAAEGFVIPAESYPTMRTDGSWIVDVPQSSEVYWHLRGSGDPGIVYQGESFELAEGTTILDAGLIVPADFAAGVDTDVEFYRPPEPVNQLIAIGDQLSFPNEGDILLDPSNIVAPTPLPVEGLTIIQVDRVLTSEGVAGFNYEGVAQDGYEFDYKSTERTFFHTFPIGIRPVAPEFGVDLTTIVTTDPHDLSVIPTPLERDGYGYDGPVLITSSDIDKVAVYQLTAKADFGRTLYPGAQTEFNIQITYQLPAPADVEVNPGNDWLTRDGNDFTVASAHAGEIEITDITVYSETDEVRVTIAAKDGYAFPAGYDNVLVFDKLNIVDPFEGVRDNQRRVMLKPGQEPRFIPAPKIGEGYTLVPLMGERVGNSAVFTFMVEPNDGSICTTEFWYSFRVIGSGKNQNLADKKNEAGDGGAGNTTARPPKFEPDPAGYVPPLVQSPVVETGAGSSWFDPVIPIRPLTPEVTVDNGLPQSWGSGGVVIGGLYKPADGEDLIAASGERLAVGGFPVLESLLWGAGVAALSILLLAARSGRREKAVLAGGVEDIGLK